MKWLVYVIGIALALCLAFAAGRYSAEGGSDTLSVKVDSFRDTILVNIRDTVPLVRKERVVCYVPVKDVEIDTVWKDGHDSLAVVQREYSDDSTYTAWVSGVRYAEWPKLDSISVRQLEIVKTIHETVTLVERKKTSRFSVGLIGGYGYGLGYKGFEPFVGVGVSYKITP